MGSYQPGVYTPSTAARLLGGVAKIPLNLVEVRRPDATGDKGVGAAVATPEPLGLAERMKLLGAALGAGCDVQRDVAIPESVEQVGVLAYQEGATPDTDHRQPAFGTGRGHTDVAAESLGNGAFEDRAISANGPHFDVEAPDVVERNLGGIQHRRAQGKELEHRGHRQDDDGGGGDGAQAPRPAEDGARPGLGTRVRQNPGAQARRRELAQRLGARAQQIARHATGRGLLGTRGAAREVHPHLLGGCGVALPVQKRGQQRLNLATVHLSYIVGNRQPATDKGKSVSIGHYPSLVTWVGSRLPLPPAGCRLPA
jgi:hypothetical protein